MHFTEQNLNSINSNSSINYNPLNDIKTTKTKLIPNLIINNNQNQPNFFSPMSIQNSKSLSNRMIISKNSINRQSSSNPILNPNRSNPLNQKNNSQMFISQNSINQQNQKIMQSQMMNQLMLQNQLQQQILQQNMMQQTLLEQQIMQQMMSNQIKNSLTNNNGIDGVSDLNIIFKVRGQNLDISVQIHPDEMISTLINKYRNKANDFEIKKKFIFNAKKLNPNLTCTQEKLYNFSVIQVINTRELMGAKI